MKKKKLLLPLALLVFGGCLLPHYGVDPGDSAQGGSGAFTPTAGTSGATQVAGASGRATAGNTGSAGRGSAGKGNAGDGNVDEGNAGAGNLGGSSGSSGTSPANGGMAGGDVNACDASEKICDGKCVAIDNVEYGCTATSCNKSACPVAGTATLACTGNACVIGSCGAGTKKCANKCVEVTDPGYGCGADTCDATSCPAPGGGTLICQGAACVVGSCGAGTKKCGNKCVPLDHNNGCGDPTNCSACAASETCEGAGVTHCECVPNNVEACVGKACGSATNNCGNLVTCTNTCKSPNTCTGGNSGPNGCGCTANDPCAVLSCGQATNSCNKTVQCANKCSGNLPICVGNTCQQCQVAADCPAPVGNTCAKAVCTNSTCGFAAVGTGVNCAGGGKCSATAAGVCVRPHVNAGDFQIDATEVTRGSYELFLAAKNGNTSGQPAVCSSWNNSYSPAEPGPAISDYEKPVLADWCDAQAYCDWAGGRMCGKRGGGSLGFDDYQLPALSQWMRACGGTSNTAYPYGSSFVQGQCNGPTPAYTESPVANVATYTQCVGGYPGLYDMSGNEEEWDDSCNGNTGAGDYCRTRGGDTYPGYPPDPTYPLKCIALNSNNRNGRAAIRCCYD